MSPLLRILLTGAAAYAVLAVLAYFYAERILFQPPDPSYTGALVPFGRVPLAGGDSLAVQYLPNADAHFTILYSHGNAEDLGFLQPVLDGIRRAGFGVLAYDYRGYGQSTGGRPSVRRAVRDAEAVYRYAVDELRIPPHRIILYGRSLGSGPTLHMASHHEAAAVVLESAFVSSYRVVTRVPLLPFDPFPNLRRVRALRRPLLVIHGTLDGVIPAWHARLVLAAARDPKWAVWVEDAGHNDLAMIAGADHGRALAEFAARVRALAGTD